MANQILITFPLKDFSLKRCTPTWQRRNRWQQVLFVSVFVCVVVASTWTAQLYRAISLTTMLQTAIEEHVMITEATTSISPVDSIPIQQHKILVVFSGPATMSEGNVDKNELYFRNLDFFLKHGVDCKVQDTIIVLGHDVAPLYRKELKELDKACERDHAHRITLVERDNVCYDMESVRIVMHGNVTDILAYDYFIYVNCGTTGPVIPKNEKNSLPWTSAFIDKMVGNVKMVGLTHCCRPAHIQSMVYGLDKVAIKIIKESPCVFDCRSIISFFPSINYDSLLGLIINHYEIGMSRTIMDNGYGIMSLTRPSILTKENEGNCTDLDIWSTSHLIQTFGKVPSLGEVLFFKTSRVLTSETAALINFTRRISWNK